MSKAIAIGEKHLILGFKGVGFEIIPLDDNTKLLQELVILSKDPDVGLVLVTESMASENPQAIREFRQRCSTILSIIPTHEGSRHVSFQEIRRSVERSLGADILGKGAN
jgi:V/A-type H+-transporting ATPase subunit F